MFNQMRKTKKKYFQITLNALNTLNLNGTNSVFRICKMITFVNLGGGWVLKGISWKYSKLQIFSFVFILYHISSPYDPSTKWTKPTKCAFVLVIRTGWTRSWTGSRIRSAINDRWWVPATFRRIGTRTWTGTAEIEQNKGDFSKNAGSFSRPEAVLRLNRRLRHRFLA